MKRVIPGRKFFLPVIASGPCAAARGCGGRPCGNECLRIEAGVRKADDGMCAE